MKLSSDIVFCILRKGYLHPVMSAAAAAAKSLQLWPTQCDPIDSSLPGSPIPGILQARTLEWVAISFSNAWKWKVKVKSPSCVRLFATPWTAAYQAPPSIGFSRQEYWGGCCFLLCWGLAGTYCYSGLPTCYDPLETETLEASCCTLV